MRPTKEQTVEKYMEQFLEGHTKTFITRFNSKTTDQKYEAIMAWRRKNSKATVTAGGVRKVVNIIRKARTEMDNTQSLTEANIAAVEREIAAFSQYVAEFRENINSRRLAELELKRSELDRQIEELRAAEQAK